MKEILVISGKGGTGKTSITASFAALSQNKVLVDCDVDAADLHLLLHPVVEQDNEFWSGQLAVIDSDKCNKCGLCQNICRFDAIDDFCVKQHSCEGCSFCFHVCPEKAIKMVEKLSGHWFVSSTKYGPMVHAKLGVAQEHSGRLVALIRNKAKQIVLQNNLDLVISDGPPGIGCPVISALSGVNIALIVTEPTLSGIHDLERVLELCRHFGIPSLVCINKYDLNLDNTARIEQFCLSQHEIVRKLPFDNVVSEAIVRGLPLVEFCNNPIAKEIEQLWELVLNIVNEKTTRAGK